MSDVNLKDNSKDKKPIETRVKINKPRTHKSIGMSVPTRKSI